MWAARPGDSTASASSSSSPVKSMGLSREACISCARLSIADGAGYDGPAAVEGAPNIIGQAEK
jgi:hypothetical protein